MINFTVYMVIDNATDEILYETIDQVKAECVLCRTLENGVDAYLTEFEVKES